MICIRTQCYHMVEDRFRLRSFGFQSRIFLPSNLLLTQLGDVPSSCGACVHAITQDPFLYLLQTYKLGEYEVDSVWEWGPRKWFCCLLGLSTRITKAEKMAEGSSDSFPAGVECAGCPSPEEKENAEWPQRVCLCGANSRKGLLLVLLFVSHSSWGGSTGVQRNAALGMAKPRGWWRICRSIFLLHSLVWSFNWKQLWRCLYTIIIRASAP